MGLAGMRRARHRRAALAVVLVIVVAAAYAGVLTGSAAAPRATGSAAPPGASSRLVLELDTGQPGNEFRPGAVGLSTEALELSTGRLSAAHRSLVRLMRLLGPAVLRIGGASVDSSWWTSNAEPPPLWATGTVTPEDLSVLHGLLAATGWRVLLGVDLGHFEPTRAADEARYAQKLLGPGLLGVEIGNEPNAYGDEERKVVLRPPTYDAGDYLREVESYRAALDAAAPGVAVVGPALSQGPWLAELGSSLAIFSEITQHYYPTSTCTDAPAAEATPTVDGLLSPSVRSQENEIVEALTKVSTLAGRPARIGETNSVGSCGATSSASSTFASALWALDWALRATDEGIDGVNFHGRFAHCGNASVSPICAPSFRDARRGEVAPQPEYYGLLAAARLEGGRFVPTQIAGDAAPPDLTTWATLASGGKISVAIDNLAASGAPQPVYIPAAGYMATVEPLTASSVEARNGIQLGRSPITDLTAWRPKLVKIRPVDRYFRVLVSPASAVIITLRR